MARRKSTILALVFVLLLEVMLVASLRWVGWYTTGNALQTVLCVFVTVLPLLVAAGLLIRKRLKFSVKSLLASTALVAIFLALSLNPLLQHRAVRQTSVRLVSENATINDDLEWDDFYSQFDLKPPPRIVDAKTETVPLWLQSFTGTTRTLPPDNAVRSISLNSDAQCRILAENWHRLPSLQSLHFSSGVSTEGFEMLRNILPRFKLLEIVHTDDVAVPPGWYGSLTNVRILHLWDERAAFRGTIFFDKKHLNDIAALSNLEMLIALGSTFDDNDARTLATSTSIKRVLLQGTGVTQSGKRDLANIDRLVYLW